jgi:hypothetical protein
VRGRSPRGGAIIVAALAALAAASCGYRAVYGADTERVHVVQVRAEVADAVAADEVTSGVREELAREGALEGGDGYPRVEVEVTRLDEASDAIAASGAPGARQPVARATQVGVVARAWLVRAAGGEHERDTGDVRVLLATSATTAAGSTGSANPPAIDELHHLDALRAAGRRAGVRLARRILGQPAPESDLLDEQATGAAR